ncbi:proline-rich protein 29 isoform X3 [Protopterus annectens]|uniref:proline-rich protein 29 isoform X3 n=1 Tax=Protopterus annectens TaxID=7888 RepID=UPI001CFBF518|nr:proline-rich protein 29 isoform X3 [Protopterus annectens]
MAAIKQCAEQTRDMAGIKLFAEPGNRDMAAMCRAVRRASSNQGGINGSNSKVPQQPTTIFQQLQSPFFAFNQPNNFRSGHVKEDLVELMMIQNAQMHQVIMNNMTMSALSQFGYSEEPPASEIPSVPVIIEDTEQEVVYHHYYDPYSYQAPSVWQNPPRPPFQSNQKQIVRHLNDTNPAVLRELILRCH